MNLREMMLFEVPIVATVIGEGGSGGALGIGVADRVLIMENAYYSVISSGRLRGDPVERPCGHGQGGSGA